MKNIVLPLMVLLTLVSCESKKNSSGVVDSKDSIIQSIDTITPVISETPDPPVVNEISQLVTYKSATYYTGRIDFFFTDEKGKRVEVGVSNMPEDNEVVASYPASMLESGEDLEGPPGANPAMVGKKFLLIKNAKGEVIEIRLAK